MTARKKIILGSTIGAAILMAVSLSLVLLSTRIANLKTVAAKIESEASRALKADVAFEQITLKYFPLPQIVLNQSRLTVPGTATVAVDTLTLFPKIVPLLTGRFRLSRVDIHRPQVRIHLPSTVDRAHGPPALSVKTWQNSIFSAVGYLISRFPGLTARLDGGQLTVTRSGRSVFSSDRLTMGLTAAKTRLEIDLHCRSDVWDRLDIQVHIDPESLDSRGHASVHQFRVQPVARRLLADHPVDVQSAAMDLTATFSGRIGDHLQAALQGSFPELDLMVAGRPIAVRGDRLEGDVFLTPTRSAVSIRRVHLTRPAMDVSGTFETGPIHGWRTAPAKFQAKIADGDIGAIRNMALTAAGDLPPVRMAADIVRSGTIPEMTLAGSVDTAGPGWAGKNLRVDGRLAAARVHLPWAGLDLDGVSGNVHISEGLLNGENITATLGQTIGRKGRLTIVQDKDRTLFKVAIDVDADLSPLPPLLKRWVPNATFDAEMERLKNVRGRASGRLVLEGDEYDIRTSVAVSDVQLSAAYDRLPGPVAIGSGRFTYGTAGVAVENLTGRLGKSAFSNLSGAIATSGAHAFAVSAKACQLNLRQIHNWLKTRAETTDLYEPVDTIDGSLFLSDVRLSGDPGKPKQWRFAGHGTLQDTVLTAARLPGPLTIARAAIDIGSHETGHRISFDDAAIDLINSTVRASGIFTGGLSRPDAGQIRLGGTLSEPFLRWLYTSLALPLPLLPKAPLSVADTQMLWRKNRAFSLAGDFSVPAGPSLRLDLSWTPQMLRITDLHIQDRLSRAAFNLTVTDDDIQTAFSGHLAERTLQHLLADYPFTDGWIQGEIRTGLSRSPDRHLSAEGRLTGSQIHIPLPVGDPVLVRSMDISAQTAQIEVKDMALTFGGQDLSIEGTVKPTAPEWTVGLVLTARDLDLDRMKKSAPRYGLVSGRTSADTRRPLPLRGNLEIAADRLTVNRMSWETFQADVGLGADRVDIAVAQGLLCGVNTPATVVVGPDKIDLDMTLTAENRPVAAALACLREGSVLATGNFDLTGTVRSQADAARELSRNAQGEMHVTARSGRIFRHVPLARLLAYLNVVEIFKAGLPDLQKDGFAYKTIHFKGHMENGRFIVTEGIINSPIMEIGCQGHIDILNKTLDLDLLVAPLQTANFLIKKMPVVSQIMGGTLVSIPLKMKGPLADPTVSALPLKMVSNGLIGILKRTLQLPIQLIEPIIP